MQPEKPDAATVDWLREQEVDVSFVMAYGHYLGASIRSVSRLGMYNFHASILPKYRGASPIESALAAGETETGISLMQVERAMDSGAVADVEHEALNHWIRHELARKAGEQWFRCLIGCFPRF